MFVRQLGRSVTARTRAKGLQYFRSGAVTRLDGAEWIAEAVVSGTRDYAVRIARDLHGFTGECECPFFQDRAEICKHIWATLLAAENHGLLSGDGSSREDLALDADYSTLDNDPAQNAAAPPPASLVRPSDPPIWQRLLADVQREADASDRITPKPWMAGGQIIYTIVIPQGTPREGVPLTVQFRRRKKTGEWSKPKPALVSVSDVDRLSDPSDREILALLIGAPQEWAYPAGGGYYTQNYPARATYQLNGSLAERVLPLVGSSGRAYVVASPDEPLAAPVAWDGGSPWHFELRVETVPDSDGLRVDGVLTRGAERMALTEPLLVVLQGFLFTRSMLARLDAAEAFSWLAKLRRTGPVVVPRNAAAVLAETLARSGVAPDLLPAELRYDVLEVAPTPCVKVTRRPAGYGYAYGTSDMLQASVQFDYGGTLAGGAGRTLYDPERRQLIRRDGVAERRAVERLHQLGFHERWNYAESRQDLGVGIEQFPRAVRTLVAEGWRVEAEGRVFRPPKAMHAHVASGVDWFELHGRVEFGDGTSAALPELLAALQRGDATVTLDDGTRGLLPEDWLRRYVGIGRFGEVTRDHIRFRPSQAALLDALLESQPAVSVDDAFSRAREALRTFDGIAPLDPPATFKGRLRAYQRDALGWFAFLRRFGFGGCLADDMGLGKTVMVLALLESLRRQRTKRERLPSLAVVPRSLVFNWIEEAHRFAPRLKVLDYTGAARDTASVDARDLVLTTYGTLRRDIARLRDVSFEYVILDEAQAIKNAATASAKAVRLLAARHRLALSGTPVENHLGELWSLFEFLNPGLLGSFAGFQTTTGRGRTEREGIALLARAVRPFVLRRTKQQVAPELPERSEQTIHCEMDGAQRRLYDQLRVHYRSTLLKRVARDGLNRSTMHVLEALLRLRQAACHPGLVDEARTGDPSAKLDVLVPLLAEVAEEGHKALVFSQFTSFLALLRPRLVTQKLPFEYLDGQTRDRAARVARFQTDAECPLFLISLKAGGLGLNLTEADYVFLLDPWWNPAVEAQAIDRAHRIGQSRNVFAYRLIARDTVEERIAELQQTKRDLASAILSADASLIRDLKPEDLDWLFS